MSSVSKASLSAFFTPGLFVPDGVLINFFYVTPGFTWSLLPTEAKSECMRFQWERGGGNAR